MPSAHISTSPQVRAAASERRSPPSAKTPMMARFRAPRRRAVSADSIRPPRPLLGSRRTSRTRARASAVRAPACMGAGARLRHPLTASDTTGWRAGLSPLPIPEAA